jgi:sterol desaturase/sphingolipid hydroxylase (fatty acid hydroxylase superfamily)
MAGGVARNLPILVLMVLYSAIVCWYGFKVQFLLKSNGVILSTLIAHLFMDLSIFVLHRTKLLRAVL